ncbi:MAG: methyl-accepting chemotaxis protein [bacterium]
MRNRQKTIKNKLVQFTAIIILCTVSVLCIFSAFFIVRSTEQSLQKTLSKTAGIVSSEISAQLRQYEIMAQSVSMIKNTVGADYGATRQYINSLVKENGLVKVDIVREDGISALNGDNYQENQAFVQAKQGTPYLSDPVTEDGEVHFDYAYPSAPHVILISIPYRSLGDIAAKVKVGNQGNTYILNHSGARVVQSDSDAAAKEKNGKSDPVVARMEANMVQGKTGFSLYKWNGRQYFGAYAPISGTDGWSVNVSEAHSEFMSSVPAAIALMIGVGILSFLIALFFAFRIAGNITRPVLQVTEGIERISGGDLDIRLEVKSQDETGRIANALNTTSENLRRMITDLCMILKAISSGDLSLQSGAAYPGDFHEILTAIDGILSGLNQTLSQVRLVAVQVDGSAGQMSDVAQALAMNASEEVSSIEKLSSSVHEISGHAQTSAENAQQANVMLSGIVRDIQDGNRKMDQLITAMKDISQTSQEIERIVKTIDDIAFQTNILALNAAVEAARAGAYGKGFAVVANEVRNLAGKSTRAVGDTSALIANTVHAISTGAKAVDEVERSLQVIVQKSESLFRLVGEISQASDAQAAFVTQTTGNITQISDAIQNISLMAEKSAAAGEELSSQSKVLTDLLSRFQLKEEAAAVEE